MHYLALQLPLCVQYVLVWRSYNDTVHHACPCLCSILLPICCIPSHCTYFILFHFSKSYIYTVFFQNTTRGDLLVWVPPRLVLPCLVLPRLDLSGFSVLFNIHIHNYSIKINIRFIFCTFIIFPRDTEQINYNQCCVFNPMFHFRFIISGHAKTTTSNDRAIVLIATSLICRGRFIWPHSMPLIDAKLLT